jgi:hypothetical protein
MMMYIAHSLDQLYFKQQTFKKKEWFKFIVVEVEEEQYARSSVVMGTPGSKATMINRLPNSIG